MKDNKKTNQNKNNIPFEMNANINNKGRISKSDCDQNEDPINDNISEKANSVQTSYRYRKNKNGPNSTSSKGLQENNQQYQQNDYDSYVEMSENDNLICPECINCTLMEQKRERENLNNLRDRDYGGFENTNALIDKNREYDRDMIDEKRRQREKNQNEAYQNLAKINAGLSSKEKLIQQNENSRNPLNEGLPDYQYQKFQDEYNRRQKMINDNINKYYPNINNERPEISSYYDNYINNPNFESSRKKYNNSLDKDRQRNYDDYDNKERNRREYIKALEDQINYKNDLKKREKEEERRRAQRQFEDMQRELKREEQERLLKEQRKKEEYKIANLELMNQKKDRKIKELQEKLKYREMVDKQNEDYQREKERQQIEKERMKDDIYNQNKNDYINRQKMKELERERDRQYNDDNMFISDQGFDPRKKCDKYDKRFDNTDYKGKYINEFGEYGSPEYINKNKKYQDRYGPKGEKGKYDQYDTGRKGNKCDEHNYDDKDRNINNINNINQYEERNKGYDSKYGERFGPKYDKYGNKEYDDKYNQFKDRYGDENDLNKKGGKKYGDNGEGKYDYRYDKDGQIKEKKRMGRCCRCHRIFPRNLLSINRYFYKENRI